MLLLPLSTIVPYEFLPAAVVVARMTLLLLLLLLFRRICCCRCCFNIVGFVLFVVDHCRRCLGRLRIVALMHHHHPPIVVATAIATKLCCAVAVAVAAIAAARTAPYRGIDLIHSRLTDPSLVAVIK